MKTSIKKSIISLLAVLSVTTMTANIASADFIENNIITKENNIISFSTGEKIKISEKSDFSISYEINDSNNSNITLEYFGLTDEYDLIKEMVNDNLVYTIKVDSEKKLDEIFANAKLLYDEGKIHNAYQKMHIVYSPISSGITIAIRCETDMIKYLNYISKPIEEVYLGDVNNDGRFNIRDAAYLARLIAENKLSSLEDPEKADYNQDKVVNIRDAAAIARDFSESME